MVICLAVRCKSDTRREGINVYEFSREENLKQQWLILIKCRIIQSIQQARMNHAYLRRFKSRLEKDEISTGPK